MLDKINVDALKIILLIRLEIDYMINFFSLINIPISIIHVHNKD